MDSDFQERVQQVLSQHALRPEWLELEITESEDLHTSTEILQRLQGLRELGVRLAIDDFGTGYSSLSRMQSLNVDRLKIDKSFVQDLANSQRARAVSQFIVNFGKAMQLDVVAEGVETAEQLDCLSQQGCHTIQGYLTGRPMDPCAFAIWAAEPGRSHV